MSKSQLLVILQSQPSLSTIAQQLPTSPVNSSIQTNSGCGGNTTCNSDQSFSMQDKQDDILFEKIHEKVSGEQRSKYIQQLYKQSITQLGLVLNGRKQYQYLLYEKLREIQKLSKDDKNLLSDLGKIRIKQINQIQSFYQNFQSDNSTPKFTINREQQENIKSIIQVDGYIKKSINNVSGYSLNKPLSQANKIDMNKLEFKNFQPVVANTRQVGYKRGKEYNQFQDFMASFQSKSYCFLYPRINKIKSFIEEKLNQWYLFEVAYTQIFKKYLDVFKAKIEIMPEWRLVYGSLQPLNYRLERILEYKGSKHRAKVDLTMTDLLFQHFVQQLQSRNIRSSIYYVRNPKNDQKIPLSDFIAATKEFFATAEWYEVFGIVQQKLIRKNPSKQELQSIQNKLKVFENSKPSVAVNKKYICCSKFFYIKENILQSQTKSKLVLAGDILQLNKSLQTVQKQICGLMNSRGGVILFDCQAISTKVVPRGSEMVEKEMEGFKQSIQQCLERIHPLPETDKNIFISFVPVAESENGEPRFIKGTYVTRITVKPDRGSVVYMLIKEEEKAEIYHRKQTLFEDGLQLFTGKKIHKYLKNKFHQYQKQCSDITPFEQQFLVPTVCDLDHRCQKPEIGSLLKEKSTANIISIENLREKYKFVSVVVAKQQHHQTIIRNLAKKGIQCEIALPFRESKLKGAPQSAVLYHNNTFEQLLNIVSYNKEFEFGGRYLLLILITPFLKLTDRSKKNPMSDEDFRSLTTWLKNQYPQEQMTVWEFINEKRETEYYIKTKTREATLYIYIVLTQYMERSAFKSPKDLQKMSKAQLQRRLILRFPKKNSDEASSKR